MSYRKEDIPGMIDALEKTIPQLPVWKYICVSVPSGHPSRDIVRSMISESLGSNYTLGQYLGVDEEEMEPKIRVSFVRKMIADLKEYAK